MTEEKLDPDFGKILEVRNGWTSKNPKPYFLLRERFPTKGAPEDVGSNM